MLKKVLGAVATAALITSGSLLSGAGTASADDGPWAACSSGFSNDCKAGHAGRYERRREIWEARGVDRGHCVNIRDLLGVAEDTLLGYKACIGESGPMTILSCGGVKTAGI